MGMVIEFENIRQMRRREGIHDADLQHAIRELRVGDCVQITIKTAAEAFHGETVLVRITRIRAGDFLGKLAQAPVSSALAHLRLGSASRSPRRTSIRFREAVPAMSNPEYELAQTGLRGTDSNTLLRLYDRAREASQHSPVQLDRQRADKALQRILRELQRAKSVCEPPPCYDSCLSVLLTGPMARG